MQSTECRVQSADSWFLGGLQSNPPLYIPSRVPSGEGAPSLLYQVSLGVTSLVVTSLDNQVRSGPSDGFELEKGVLRWRHMRVRVAAGDVESCHVVLRVIGVAVVPRVSCYEPVWRWSRDD